MRASCHPTLQPKLDLRGDSSRRRGARGAVARPARRPAFGRAPSFPCSKRTGSSSILTGSCSNRRARSMRGRVAGVHPVPKSVNLRGRPTLLSTLTFLQGFRAIRELYGLPLLLESSSLTGGVVFRRNPVSAFRGRRPMVAGLRVFL